MSSDFWEIIFIYFGRAPKSPEIRQKKFYKKIELS